MQWTGDPRKDAEINRGLLIVQMKGALRGIIESLKGQEFPDTPRGYLRNVVEEFDLLFRSGVIRLQVFSDEEASQYGGVSVAHGTSQEKEKTALFIGMHPGVTAAFLKDETPDVEKEKTLNSLVLLIIQLVKRYRELQGAGARFAGTLAIPDLPNYLLHDPRLRYLESDKRARSENYGIIIYTVLGDQCVFTQATSETTSSINRAEWILMDIAKAERKDPKTLQFFDLQTQLGYGEGGGVYEPGMFMYGELGLEWRDDWPSLKAWRPVRCPEHILRLFSPFIGPNPRQSDAPN